MARRTLCTRALLVWGNKREQSWRASLADGLPSLRRPGGQREREGEGQRERGRQREREGERERERGREGEREMVAERERESDHSRWTAMCRLKRLVQMSGSGRPHRYWVRDCRTSVSRPNVLGCSVTTSAGHPSGPAHTKKRLTIYSCMCTLNLVRILWRHFSVPECKIYPHLDRQLSMVMTQPGKSSTASVTTRRDTHTHTWS